MVLLPFPQLSKNLRDYACYWYTVFLLKSGTTQCAEGAYPSEAEISAQASVNL